MKPLQKLGPFILLALIGVLGCEHDVGSDAGIGGGPISFTGSYTPASGHSAVVEVPSVTTNAVIGNATETIGTGDGTTKTYNFTASYVPIVPGTVVISDGVETFDDNATSSTNGTLVSRGSGMGFGSINYATGEIRLRFVNNVKTGVAIPMTYQYVVQAATVNSPLVTQPITMLSVSGDNKGETKLTFTDNNGGAYSGTSSGIVAPDATNSPQQFAVSATFSVAGSNRVNQNVAISGSFSAYYDSGVLKNRRIVGTYRDSDGVSGNVLGNANDIDVGPIVTTNAPSL